jgi:oligopeptide transport system permease protein
MAFAANAPSIAKGRSLWGDARIRYLRNRAAVLASCVLVLLIAFVLIGPVFAQYSIEEIDWGIMGQAAELGKPTLANGHFFGADDLGRDLYARTLQGTTTSLMVGLIGASVALVVGTAYGAIAGYVGGRTDNIMMRIVDILLAIPSTLVIILLMVIFERSLIMIFIGLGLTGWLTMSRVVRGQTLSLMQREFVEAARASGVSDVMIIWRHILPNLLGVVIVYASILVPEMILAESFISFLGLGVQEPNTSLGALIAEGAGTMAYGTLWQLMIPLSFFMLTILCMFFIGDGLRDALDPKDR